MAGPFAAVNKDSGQRGRACAACFGIHFRFDLALDRHATRRAFGAMQAR